MSNMDILSARNQKIDQIEEVEIDNLEAYQNFPTFSQNQNKTQQDNGAGNQPVVKLSVPDSIKFRDQRSENHRNGNMIDSDRLTTPPQTIKTNTNFGQSMKGSLYTDDWNGQLSENRSSLAMISQATSKQVGAVQKQQQKVKSFYSLQESANENPPSTKNDDYQSSEFYEQNGKNNDLKIVDTMYTQPDQQQQNQLEEVTSQEEIGHIDMYQSKPNKGIQKQHNFANEPKQHDSIDDIEQFESADQSRDDKQNMDGTPADIQMYQSKPNQGLQSALKKKKNSIEYQSNDNNDISLQKQSEDHIENLDMYQSKPNLGISSGYKPSFGNKKKGDSDQKPMPDEHIGNIEMYQSKPNKGISNGHNAKQQDTENNDIQIETQPDEHIANINMYQSKPNQSLKAQNSVKQDYKIKIELQDDDIEMYQSKPNIVGGKNNSTVKKQDNSIDALNQFDSDSKQQQDNNDNQINQINMYQSKPTQRMQNGNVHKQSEDINEFGEQNVEFNHDLQNFDDESEYNMQMHYSKQNKFKMDFSNQNMGLSNQQRMGFSNQKKMVNSNQRMGESDDAFKIEHL